MSFTFNGGSPIYFDNWEVRGDVEYIPATTPETYLSESGIVVSQNRPQREYFRFTLRYDTVLTRQKVNTIFKAIQSNYRLAFSFPHFIAPFSTFPPVDTLIPLTENFKHSAGFTSAVIEFPQDFSYDRIGRGIGSDKVKDIEIKVYRSAAFTIPLTPCAALNALDVDDVFTLHPWNLNGSNELQYVLVEPKSSVITVTSWPIGILFYDNIVTGFRDVLSPAGMVGNAQKYVPSGVNTVDSIWSLAISLIPVTLPSGESCTVNFEQQYGTPPSDFNADFNADFN